jgi:hypothetical protein
MKIGMILKYKGRQSLSAIARELGFVVSTVNIIVKNAAPIKENVNEMAVMKSTTLKKCEGAIKMEKLLYYWYIFHLCVSDIMYDGVGGDKSDIRNNLLTQRVAERTICKVFLTSKY